MMTFSVKGLNWMPRISATQKYVLYVFVFVLLLFKYFCFDKQKNEREKFKYYIYILDVYKTI